MVGLTIALTACPAGVDDGPSAVPASTTTSPPTTPAGTTISPRPLRVVEPGNCDIVIINDADQLLDWVDDVLIGTVVSTGAAEGSPIRSPFGLRVDEVVAGDESVGEVLDLWLVGGIANGVHEKSYGPAMPDVGHQRLALLSDRPGVGTNLVFDLLPFTSTGTIVYSGSPDCSSMKRYIGTPVADLLDAVRAASIDHQAPRPHVDPTPATTSPLTG